MHAVVCPAADAQIALRVDGILYTANGKIQFFLCLICIRKF